MKVDAIVFGLASIANSITSLAAVMLAEAKPIALDDHAHLRHGVAAGWGGIFNTRFWIDPHRGVAAVVLMQLVPDYDSAAIDVLRGFEREVYRENARPSADAFIVLPSSVR
jgi:CubicO group peptidase (beta-lactamase class C family)